MKVVWTTNYDVAEQRQDDGEPHRRRVSGDVEVDVDQYEHDPAEAASTTHSTSVTLRFARCKEVASACPETQHFVQNLGKALRHSLYNWSICCLSSASAQSVIYLRNNLKKKQQLNKVHTSLP